MSIYTMYTSMHELVYEAEIFCEKVIIKLLSSL